MFIPDPDTDFLSIPDPGVKKTSDPGSGSATLLESNVYRKFFISGDEEAAQDAEVALVLLRRPVAVEKVVECLDILGKLCHQFLGILLHQGGYKET